MRRPACLLIVAAACAAGQDPPGWAALNARAAEAEASKDHTAAVELSWMALEAARDFAPTDPRLFETRLRFARTCRISNACQTRDARYAIDGAFQARQAVAADAVTLAELGLWLAEWDRHREAVTCYREAAERFKRSPGSAARAMADAAWVELAAGEPANARRTMEAAIETGRQAGGPLGAALREELALLISKPDAAEAVVLGGRMRRRGRDPVEPSTESLSNTARVEAQHLVDRAEAEARNGRLVEAVDLGERALLRWRSLQSLPGIAHTAGLLAGWYIELGDYVKAEAAFEEADSVDYTSTPMLRVSRLARRLSVLYEERKEYRRAAEKLVIAVRFDDKYDRAGRVRLAGLYDRAGDHRKASDVRWQMGDLFGAVGLTYPRRIGLLLAAAAIAGLLIYRRYLR